MKPCGLAELSHGLQAEESVSLDSPAALATQHAGKNVSDGVDIRRNVEAPPKQVVAGIDDDRNLFGRHHLAEAINEFRSARTTGENANHAALRAKPWASVAARSFSERTPG